MSINARIIISSVLCALLSFGGGLLIGIYGIDHGEDLNEFVEYTIDIPDLIERIETIEDNQNIFVDKSDISGEWYIDDNGYIRWDKKKVLIKE